MRYRNEMFGIAAIWILFFHIYDNIGGSCQGCINALRLYLLKKEANSNKKRLIICSILDILKLL